MSSGMNEDRLPMISRLASVASFRTCSAGLEAEGVSGIFATALFGIPEPAPLGARRSI